MNKKRCGIYARCSTDLQSTDNQLIELRRYVEQRGWEISKEYVDQGISGAKDRRPALDQLMADARKRKLDIVLVWKFDRYARSAQHLLNSLAEFRSLGVDFCSVQDAVDTTTPYGKAMFTVIGAMAELERELIRSRVIHGVQKARERGKHIGRPKVTFDLVRAKALASEGHSYVTIGRILGISRMTAARALAQNPIEKPLIPSVELAASICPAQKD
jgi:DNA invertase Pin-like site-specific DNA recombinase